MNRKLEYVLIKGGCKLAMPERIPYSKIFKTADYEKNVFIDRNGRLLRL